MNNHFQNIEHFPQIVKQLFLMDKLLVMAFRSISVLLLMVFPVIPAHAALEDITIGARPSSLSGACIACAGNAECIFYNPAAIYRTNGFGINTYYTHPFGMPELSVGTISLVLPVKGFSAGMAMSTYGNNLYREDVFHMATSVLLLEHVALGFDGRYSRIKIARYGEAGTLVFDLGILVKISQQLAWGCAIKNINYAKIGRGQEQIPQIFHSGFAIRPVRQAHLFFDIYKDVRFPTDLRCGVEYMPFSNLFLRAGVGSDPARFSAGFGLRWRIFSFEYAFTSHNELGGTHHFAIAISK